MGIVEGQWGSIVPAEMVEADKECTNEKDKMQAKSRRMFSVCSFSPGTNRKHHGKCIDESNNAFSCEKNNHPKSVEDVMTCLSHCMDEN